MSYKTTFIITARNEVQSVVDRTIEGLLDTTPVQGREIIVVDDGSETPVNCSRPEVALFRNAGPIGVSRSRRYGASLAGGDVLVWLDAHMTFAPDWLGQMLEFARSGALLCSAFWDYEQSVCHCWGADFTWCGERDYWRQRYPGFGLTHRTVRPSAAAVAVPMAIGACYMMLRSSYTELGGFSPLFRVWGVDEQDFSMRAWMAGCGVKCVTGARVGHFFRPAFPYPVHFEHLEFNQIAMIRTIFEPATAAALEEYFDPIPSAVEAWLERTDIQEWRAVVQRPRLLSDSEMFQLLAIDGLPSNGCSGTNSADLTAEVLEAGRQPV